MKWIKLEVEDDFDITTFKDLKINIWEPKYLSVLDRGFVGLIDFMGCDDDIVSAARVSYGGGTSKKSTMTNLIRYLVRYRHTSPLEMVEFKFHIKAPIFLFRQIHRHRTASINELSGRYSILNEEFYLPSQMYVKPQSKTNKQGRDGTITREEYIACIAAMEQVFDEAYSTYKYLLGPNENGGLCVPDLINQRKLMLEGMAIAALKTKKYNELVKKSIDYDGNSATVKDVNDLPPLTKEEMQNYITMYYEANEAYFLDGNFSGLARELARMVLPLSTYSEMYWKMDLHNLFNFIKLRSAPDAQQEVRDYANAILELIKPIVPIAIQAFVDYIQDAKILSRMELNTIKSLLLSYNTREYDLEIDFHSLNEKITSLMKAEGASDREIREFIEIFSHVDSNT